MSKQLLPQSIDKLNGMDKRSDRLEPIQIVGAIRSRQEELDKKVDALTKEVQRIQYDMASVKVKNERLEKALEALGIRQ